VLVDEIHLCVDLPADAVAAQVSVEVRTPEGGVRKAALIAYSFLDADGNAVPPVGKHASSEKFGPFFYLSTADQQPAVQAARLEKPEGAVALELRGHAWASKGAVEIVSGPQVHLDRPGADSAFVDALGNPTTVRIEDFRAVYQVTPGSRHLLEWVVDAPAGTQGLLHPRYFGDDGVERLPGEDLPISPQHGAYIYAVDSDGETERSRELVIPPTVSTVEITGRAWKGKGVKLVQRPTLSAVRVAADTPATVDVGEYLRALPAGAKVVVVYTTAGPMSSGNTLLLRSNRLSLEYAKAGWHVVYVPFSEPAPADAGVIGERLVQVEPSRVQAVMDVLLSRRDTTNVLVCSSFSDLRMVGVIDRCHDHGWRVIYEVRDDMEEFRRVGLSKWYEPNLESRFAARADAVVAVSPRLRDKIATIAGRDDVVLIPNAAPDELISAAESLRTREAWDARRGSSLVGYIGHLTASWFDWAWLTECAEELPAVTFEIIGHGMPEGMSLPTNIRYLGAKSHDECLDYVARWRAGLIPFRISRLTYGVDPNKAYEYAAMGLWTISAPMGQVAEMPASWVYTSQREMADAIVRSVETEPSPEDLRRLEVFVEEARWTRRAQQMIRILEG
jgi:hypothetical protein